MNRPATFRAADLTRAIRATLKAGVPVGGAVIRPSGEIELKFAPGAIPDGDDGLDAELAAFEARHGQG
jgi:hypothetical protein